MVLPSDRLTAVSSFGLPLAHAARSDSSSSALSRKHVESASVSGIVSISCNTFAGCWESSRSSQTASWCSAQSGRRSRSCGNEGEDRAPKPPFGTGCRCRQTWLWPCRRATSRWRCAALAIQPVAHEIGALWVLNSERRRWRRKASSRQLKSGC